MADLKGKRALVTGASSGIGAAIAHELARRGVHVVLSARRRTELEAVATRCAAQGVATEVIPADLGTPGGARTLWHAALRTPVDILINNAGFGYFRPFTDVDWARDAELLQLDITVAAVRRAPARPRRSRLPRQHRVDRRVSGGAEHGALRGFEGVRAQLHRSAARRIRG
jgi:short-subunit dehydrogenase